MSDNKIHLVECPRDAMQGWKHFIPTNKKIDYINALLRVGFGTIDFGSFVSAKAIPQMADTRQVIAGLELGNTKSSLLAIIANIRGAQDAVAYDEIAFLGFPFSISQTFQLRNANSTIEASFANLQEIMNICLATSKELAVYISMGFGNPYGDVYSEQIVFEWVEKISAMGVKIISLADTVGLAEPVQVGRITNYLVDKFPNNQFGVHLHSTPFNREAKIKAALDAGCTRFDGAMKGIGGCPMADDVLVGNIDTEWLIGYFNELHRLPPLDLNALQESIHLAEEIFHP